VECIELAYIYSASGTLHLSLDNGFSRSMELLPGTCAFLPNKKLPYEVNTLFEMERSSPVKMVTIFITPEKLSSLMGTSVYFLWNNLSGGLWEEDEINHDLYFEMAPAVESAVFQILQCSIEGPARKLFIEGKVLELLALEIDSKFGKKSPCTALSPKEVELLHQVKQIMVDSMLDPPTLAELARKVGLNEKKIKTEFRHLFGQTVYGFLNSHRMETAKRMMEQEFCPVSEAAWAVGYVNVSHFSSSFRKRFGVLPGDYLRDLRNRLILPHL
jgi:AraC-like DNA-binding protein